MKTRTIFNSFKNHVPLRRISDTRNGNRPVTVISSLNFRDNSPLEFWIMTLSTDTHPKLSAKSECTVKNILLKRLFHLWAKSLWRIQHLGKYLRCCIINRFTWARKTIPNVMIAKTKTGITKIWVLFKAIFSLPIPGI